MRKSTRWCIVWLTLALVPFAGAVSYGDEMPDSAPPAVTADAATPTNWDSLYSVINTGYQRVEPIFRRGCYDCHSIQTDYPWYHSLPLVKGFLDDHIKEGREHLDLTDGFPFKGKKQRADDLFEIKEVLLEGEMPLWSYKLMHWGAAPDDVEIDSIMAWVDESLQLLAAHGQYPFGRPELLEDSDHEAEE